MSKSLQQYLDGAVQVLDKCGIKQREGEESQLAVLLQDVVQVDEPRVMAIARVVSYQSTFNELVRDRIESSDVTSDYQKITALFDSIREDSKELVAQLADGKIDWKEALKNSWMKVSRGTPHARFEKINKLYQGVSVRTREQLGNEGAIVDAYMDFRAAMKQAEIESFEVLKLQERKALDAKTAFVKADEAVKSYSGSDQAERSQLQLKRDEANRAFLSEDKRFQLIKDVAENMQIGYNVGETLVAKLQQTHDLKERVYRQAVTFFTTNEHVFTTMDAVYTSQHGLHDQTQTLEAMKSGVNKGLEDIAELGTELESAALKAGYGPTINASSVQKLVDAMVKFQTESYDLIKNLREESTKNANEVRRIVDEGKTKTREALGKYLSGKTAEQK